ncbi:MAG: mannose-1-phosphate guanylyltransferase [Phycisphaerales bacterium]|nr:mannose-1-phosphate guanylyltransferase [Phycisphaerales bacterium]
MRYAMIMAGGAGTRLWPMSRAGQPKQLVPFIARDSGQRVSLLRIAADRLEGLVPLPQRLICTGEAHREAIKQAIPGFADAQLLGEPEGRDTANAVGFAAAVLHKQDPEAIFAVLTADHLITPEDEFRRLIGLGFDLVEEDPARLVTFSIKPTYPATGFGYVERSTAISGAKYGGLAYNVERFVEKPSLERAQAYVESGAFGWNSGMFVWKAATILDCLRRYKPESYEGLMKIAEAWGTAKQADVLREVYPTLPKISVDYAVMEPASREQKRSKSIKVCTMIMDLSWLDVGSWPSYGETLDADASGNRVSGRAAMHGGKKNLVVSDDPEHLVALVGCEGLIVVHTARATLVMPADQAQDLKALHAGLPAELR